MRIDCEQCGAVFAVEDRLIPAKGVRAQCPKCRAIKLVTRPDAPAAPTVHEAQTPPQGTPWVGAAKKESPTPSASPAGRRSNAPSGKLGAVAKSGGTDPVPSPSVAGAQAPSKVRRSDASSGGRGSLPKRSADSVASSPVAGSEAASVVPRANPASGGGPSGPAARPAASTASDETDFSSLETGSQSATPFADEADFSELVDPATEKMNARPVVDFSDLLPDPMQSAPPRPDAERDWVSEFTSGAPASAPADASEQLWKGRAPPPPVLAQGARPAAPSPASLPPIVTDAPAGSKASMACSGCGKPLTDPFDLALGNCDGCRQKAMEASSSPPAAPRPAPAATSAAAQPSSPPPGAAMNFARPDAPKSRRVPLMILGGVAVAAVIAVGVVFALNPSKLGFKPAAPVEAPVPQAVKDTLPRWKLSFVGLTGDAKQFLAEGRDALALDTPSGYLDAEEGFQKALIADPRSDEAIIGYCRAVALGRGPAVDDATWKEAVALISAAQQRSHNSPQSLVAEAELRLARPSDATNLERARTVAERASATKDAQAHAEAELILGRTYAATSLALALNHFQRALELAPELSRVHYERALAYEAAGDVRQAMASLGERLKSNPDQPEALAALSRLYQEVGDTAAARQVYQRVLDKRPGDFHPSLMLAVLLYQSEGKAPEAVRALKALAKEQDRYDDREKVLLFVHLAAAQRAAGDPEGALDSVNAALATSNSDPAAHLQGLLLALDKGLASEANRHLGFVKGAIGDPALELMISARVLLEDQKFDAAAAAYRQAVELDPRRVDGRIMAGVALARAGNREAALSALAPLSDADPGRVAPRPTGTRFYLPPLETLKDAGVYVGKLGTGANDVVPRVYQALIDWHCGRREDARRLFEAVIAEDAGDAVAHSYLSLIATANRELGVAAKEGERAVGAGRRKPLAHYALATALIARGEKERAGKELTEAEALSPMFLSAQLQLATLEAGEKQTARARERLIRTLASDPSYLAAKRVLYGLGE